MLNKLMARVTLVGCICGISLAAHAMADTARQVDVAAGGLVPALESLAKQEAVELVYQPEQLRSFHTSGVKGLYPPQEAIRILLKGIPLELRTDPTGAMVIAPPQVNAAPRAESTNDDSKEAGKKSSQDFRLAQVGQANAGPQVASKDEESGGTRRPAIEEVVVTGTHIRGVTETASPLTAYSRDDIDLAGAGSLDRFLGTISQNLNTTSPMNVGNVAGGAANPVAGAGVNLRGLGSDSTLVLVNGRRLAPGDLTGDYVDVSMIPVSAIDHVDVMPDGSSAIYGSDAVGGVVNIVLRQHFEGAESRVGYGSVTQGGDHQIDASQTFGHAWASGSALLSYAYTDQTKLLASDRDYTKEATAPFTLIPSQVKQSVYGTANQALSASTVVFVDGQYSQRSTSGGTTTVPSQGFSLSQPSETQTYSVTAGLRATVLGGREFELSGSYAESHTDFTEYDLLSNSIDDTDTVHSSALSLDAKFDGELLRLASGPVLFAIGGQFRKETLDEMEQFVGSPRTEFSPDRHIGAGFVELHAPLLGSADSPSSGRLELELADRFEHYSDFGSTNNPKVGLVWNDPVGLKIHATYGTSFKAPLLDNMNPVPTQTLILAIPDPTINGTTNTLFLSGGNPDLQPQKAKTWTVGFDLKPTSFPQWSLSANYFDIKYDGRITLPQFSVGPFNVLSEASLLGSLVQRDPSVAFLQELVDSAVHFFNIPGVPLSQVGAFVDYRYHNLSSVITRGVDFGVGYHESLAIGDFEAGVNGTKLTKITSQVLPTTPAIDILNTPYNPNGLRFRAHSSLSYHRFGLMAALNYTDSYTDNRQSPAVPIASWTTVDVAGTYAIGSDGGALHDTTLILSVLNLTDRAPPFVQNLNFTDSGINFDGVNANPLGRYISLQLTKRW